jgi:tRNA uridine 5-carboxymethylaminomethyl modification enzyme
MLPTFGSPGASRDDDEDWAAFAALMQEAERMHEDAKAEAETRIKYAGYLARQEELISRTAAREHFELPGDLDYAAVAGLSREIVEKLLAIRPRTLGQAGRISGVTPAASNCLEIHLRKMGMR